MIPEREWPVFALEEVAQHRTHDDAWIVVRDRVYDMTPHGNRRESNRQERP
jgi:hypothetical protein